MNLFKAKELKQPRKEILVEQFFKVYLIFQYSI